MNKLENGVIKYQIQMEAYKNGKANEIVSLLDKADSEIAKFIKKTDGVYTKKRYTEIARKLRDVSASLKENVGNNIDLDGIIDYELKKQKSLLNSIKPDIIKVKGGEVNFLYPTREQIKTAALFRPVTEGFTYDSYLDGIEAGLYNTWDSAVRTGYLTGQTTQQIVRNVMGGVSPQAKLKEPGAINALRNSVCGNTRTVLQSFANETQRRVYEENDELFGDKAPNGETYKYEYLATLDSRTCLVCGSLGGKLFKELKDVPNIPQHRGCRCVMLPYFNIEGEKIASKNGYTENVTFDKWLEKQDEETQKDVLGKTRYEMYQSKKSVEQFVDNGRVLTLEELANKTLSLKNNSLVTALDIDDFELLGDMNGIKKEVIDEIYNVVHQYEKEGKIYINDFLFTNIPGNGEGIPLMQIEPIGNRMIRLNVNKLIVEGRTVKELDERIAASKDIAANSLREAAIHECGHARLIKNLTNEEITKLYKELRTYNIEGVSTIAYKDGVEAIAEIEVLLSREEPIDKKLIEFYKKYIL